MITVVIVTAVLLALRMVLNSRWSRIRIGAGLTKWAWFNIDLKKGSSSVASRRRARTWQSSFYGRAGTKP